MRYIICALLIFVSGSVLAQSHINAGETKQDAIVREWNLMEELIQMDIDTARVHIANALLNPDQMYHKTVSGLVSAKPVLIPMKRLRADLDRLYKHKNTVRAEYVKLYKASLEAKK